MSKPINNTSPFQPFLLTVPAKASNSSEEHQLSEEQQKRVKELFKSSTSFHSETTQDFAIEWVPFLVGLKEVVKGKVRVAREAANYICDGGSRPTHLRITFAIEGQKSSAEWQELRTKFYKYLSDYSHKPISKESGVKSYYDPSNHYSSFKLPVLLNGQTVPVIIDFAACKEGKLLRKFSSTSSQDCRVVDITDYLEGKDGRAPYFFVDGFEPEHVQHLSQHNLFEVNPGQADATFGGLNNYCKWITDGKRAVKDLFVEYETAYCTQLYKQYHLEGTEEQFLEHLKTYLSENCKEQGKKTFFLINYLEILRRANVSTLEWHQFRSTVEKMIRSILLVESDSELNAAKAYFYLQSKPITYLPNIHLVAVPIANIKDKDDIKEDGIFRSNSKQDLGRCLVLEQIPIEEMNALLKESTDKLEASSFLQKLTLLFPNRGNKSCVAFLKEEIERPKAWDDYKALFATPEIFTQNLETILKKADGFILETGRLLLQLLQTAVAIPCIDRLLLKVKSTPEYPAIVDILVKNPHLFSPGKAHLIFSSLLEKSLQESAAKAFAFYKSVALMKGIPFTWIKGRLEELMQKMTQEELKTLAYPEVLRLCQEYKEDASVHKDLQELFTSLFRKYNKKKGGDELIQLLVKEIQNFSFLKKLKEIQPFLPKKAVENIPVPPKKEEVKSSVKEEPQPAKIEKKPTLSKAEKDRLRIMKAEIASDKKDGVGFDSIPTKVADAKLSPLGKLELHHFLARLIEEETNGKNLHALLQIDFELLKSAMKAETAEAVLNEILKMLHFNFTPLMKGSFSLLLMNWQYLVVNSPDRIKELLDLFNIIFSKIEAGIAGKYYEKTTLKTLFKMMEVLLDQMERREPTALILPVIERAIKFINPYDPNHALVVPIRVHALELCSRLLEGEHNEDAIRLAVALLPPKVDKENPQVIAKVAKMQHVASIQTAWAAVQQSNEKDDETLVALTLQIADALNGKKMQEAKDLYDKAKLLYPKWDAKFWCNIADIAFPLDCYDWAIEVLKKALNLHPKSVELHHQMGLFCHKEGMNCVDIKKKLHPRTERYMKLNSKADQLFKNSIVHFKELEQGCHENMKLDLCFATSYYQLYLFEYNIKGDEFVRAKKHIEKYTKRYPKDASGWALRGHIAFQEKQFADSKLFHKTALELDKKNPVLYKNFLCLPYEFKEASDDQKEYEKLLNEAFAKWADNVDFIYIQACYFSFTDRADEALKLYERILEMEPSDVENYLLLPKHFIAHKKYERALAIIEHGINTLDKQYLEMLYRVQSDCFLAQAKNLEEDGNVMNAAMLKADAIHASMLSIEEAAKIGKSTSFFGGDGNIYQITEWEEDSDEKKKSKL